MRALLVAVALSMLLVGCDDPPSPAPDAGPEVDCQMIGDRPPCCAYWGHRDLGGYCEEGPGFHPDDAGS
ncbi:MAG: hypothetical protein R3B82_02250 [Sandaracinaceae bacterium]